MSENQGAGGPVFQVEQKAGFASRMLQYMVAVKFQSLVPGCRIANVMLPEWGIEHPPVESPGPVIAADQYHSIDLDELTERASAGEGFRVVYSGLGRRLENILDVEACRGVFRSPAVAPLAFDERHLVCPIVAEDTPDDRGPFHPLTPVEFYAEVVAETGLTPVFVGQGAEDLYTERLRAQFPTAQFAAAGNALGDFETIRQAKNIVVNVSTFSWLAAWLSHADRIFMPVNGVFNPQQYRLVDLLPLGDSRYRCTLFPINYAVAVERHAAAHRRIAPFWRPVSHDELRRLSHEPRRFEPSDAEILAAFDAEFYFATYPDVAGLVGSGNTEGARAHYMLLGRNEQRLPFRLGQAWYAARYPMAAMEVAQGDYTSLAHHYIAVGRERGYRPLPNQGEPWWD
jgi:hypothetical protein